MAHPVLDFCSGLITEMAFDQYAWLDKRQSFEASNAPYTGASTYQFSEWTRYLGSNPGPKNKDLLVPSIPPPRSRIKQACEKSFQPKPQYTQPHLRSRPNVSLLFVYNGLVLLLYFF